MSMSFDEIFDYLTQPQHEIYYAGEGVAGIKIPNNTTFQLWEMVRSCLEPENEMEIVLRDNPGILGVTL